MLTKKNLMITAAAVMLAASAQATEKAPAKPKLHDIPLIEDKTPVASAEADVAYVTGGVGEDEVAELQSKKADYNVHILNTRADGAYLEDTEVTIHRKNGKDFIEVFEEDAGPLLFVKLPAGSYSITAERGKETKRRDIVISEKTKARDVNFVWAAALKN